MTPKEAVSKILLNVVKIFGAGWLGFLFGWVAYYVCQAFRPENEKIEYITLISTATLVTVIVLVVMSCREWYTERTPPSTKTLLLHAAAPALVHMLLCIISFGNIYIMMIPTYFSYLLADMEVESIRMEHIVLTTLIFDPIYAGALFVGGIMGRRKRVKDRNRLLGGVQQEP